MSCQISTAQSHYCLASNVFQATHDLPLHIQVFPSYKLAFHSSIGCEFGHEGKHLKMAEKQSFLGKLVDFKPWAVKKLKRGKELKWKTMSKETKSLTGV